MGCIVQIHPTVSDEHGRSPDFKSISPDGSESYIEAVTVSEDWEGDRGAAARVAYVYDQINDLESPNFLP